MPRLDRRTLYLGVGSLLATLIPSQATAHPAIVTSSPFAAGFFHSITGIDHALAMIAVGALSTKLRRSDIVLLPSTFLAFLAMGAGGGHLGLELSFTETAIAISCLVLGACILSTQLQRYRGPIFGVVAGFAAVHGYAHRIELPAGSSVGQFTLGFLSASAIMHVTGVFVGEAFKDEEHRWLIQIFGSAMIAFGALFLALASRTTS